MEEYTDREGAIQKTLEVNGSDMQFIGSREGGGDYSGGGENVDRDDHDTHSGPPQTESSTAASASSSADSSAGSSAPAVAPATDDDIPF